MATNLVDILTGTQLGYFSTISIPNEIVGEVDPFFVAAFFHELQTDWDIVDRKGNIHKIQFNGLANKPLLTTGWDQLRNDFSWTEIKLLHFYYYGGKKFYMIINNNKDLEIPSFFPPFHSLSSSVGNNKTFGMQIRNEDVNETTMIIGQTLDIFITARGHSQFKLCGPLNNVITVDLIRNTENGRRLKFGQGWTNFCQLNQISCGNILKFTASSDIAYSNILLVEVV
ncbi:hypothetical protein QL285_043525 [Trifolium repens]|nr:hypothetical protein QL285_043525 [Trifolium repens]